MTDMPEKPDSEQQRRHVHAYQRMVERARQVLHGAEAGTLPTIRRAIEVSKDTAVDLGELTREEAEWIGNALLHDLHDAAAFMTRTGREFSAWLQFDIKLIGDRIVDALLLLVDQSRLELGRLSAQGEPAAEWSSGELTVGGTFECTSCAYQFSLSGPARLDPCPRCHAQVFRRVVSSPG
jgi:Zinc-ribbon containing domain